MNIFKKFKVTFNLRNPNKKAKEKGESEVKCLKYRVYSEFSSEHVFDTNPRHIKDEPFTPTQSRKLHTRSVSENNIALKTLTPNQEKPEELNKNRLWPSESDINQKHEQNDLEQTQHETKNIIEIKQDDKPAEAKQRKEKGILKNKHESVEREKRYLQQSESNEDDNYAQTSFNEEVTYEQFDPIDDQLEEEDIYYFDHKEIDTKDQFVVHKSTTVKFAESDHEYEEPVRKNERNQKEEVNPVYNLSTHPKLNPTVQGSRDDEYAKSIGLNTFGNTQKLKYPGDYSLEAKSIFFDDENDYDC